MRTVIVIFTDKKVSLYKASSYKRYKFLCNYDNISIYDIIEDPRYPSKMMVVAFTCNTNRVQQGLTLKDIYITKLNGKAINQPVELINGSLEESNKQKTNNMEEKRNIEVTLEQAREWYNSGNSTLHKLALSAYTEDELKLSLRYICSKVPSTCFYVSVPDNEAVKYNTLADLAIIAKFFNGSWKKTPNNTGYFIGDSNGEYGPVVDTYNGVDIYQHNTVKYAGIVYFKNQEDVIKAIKILGKRVKNLFD